MGRGGGGNGRDTVCRERVGRGGGGRERKGGGGDDEEILIIF